MRRMAPATLLLLASVLPSNGALEFSAYILSDGQYRFLVSDLEAGKSSGWLSLGQTFQGYTLKEFERTAEVLVIARDDGVQRLFVKKDRIADGENQLPRTRRVMFDFAPDGALLTDDGPITWETAEQMLRAELMRPGKLLVHLRQPKAPGPELGKRVGETIKHFTNVMLLLMQDLKARNEPRADLTVSIASKGSE